MIPILRVILIFPLHQVILNMKKKNVNDPLENQFFSSACFDNFDENTITENGLNLATIKDSGVPIHEDECPEHLRDLEMVELGNIPDTNYVGHELEPILPQPNLVSGIKKTSVDSLWKGIKKEENALLFFYIQNMEKVDKVIEPTPNVSVDVSSVFCGVCKGEKIMNITKPIKQPSNLIITVECDCKFSFSVNSINYKRYMYFHIVQSTLVKKENSGSRNRVTLPHDKNITATYISEQTKETIVYYLISYKKDRKSIFAESFL